MTKCIVPAKAKNPASAFCERVIGGAVYSRPAIFVACPSSSSTPPTRRPPTSRRRSPGWPRGWRQGEQFQTLLGATGTGKTFTMAATIAAVQRPSLVIAHNKTLAAQLCNEFREFFPENAVEYFVSYYDYYQPEAYVPAQDLYIEKDSSINDEIDRLRHAATAALFARRDVIIVASVSCIYGIGSPQVYNEKMQLFKVGEEIDRDEVLRKLVKMQYQRNDRCSAAAAFRVRGEVLEIMPSYAESAYRIALFGDEIEGIQHFDPLTGEVLDTIDHVSVWPASHYVTRDETLERAVEEIRAELNSRTAELEAEGKQLEAHRLRQRTAYDIEMLKEIGFTSGIENYSRILDGRPVGQPAAHADRLLPRRLRRLRRRVPPDDSADRRHVRGGPLAQADPDRLRLPPALGDRQPAAQVRRVPRTGAAAGHGLGDAGAVRAGRVDADRSSRSCGRPGSSTPRSSCARRATRSTT